MLERKKLECFSSKCTVEYETKNEAFGPEAFGPSTRNVYDVRHDGATCHVYETIMPPIIIVSLSGSDFPFACAVLFSQTIVYGQPFLVYLDRHEEGLSSDLSAHFLIDKENNFRVDDALKKALLDAHLARGFQSTVIDLAECENAAMSYFARGATFS